MLRNILAFLGCMASVVAAARGNVGVDRRVGWMRKPLAVGSLSGFRFGPEPYLLEFHGANCDHCEVTDGCECEDVFYRVLYHADAQLIAVAFVCTCAVICMTAGAARF